MATFLDVESDVNAVLSVNKLSFTGLTDHIQCPGGNTISFPLGGTGTILTDTTLPTSAPVATGSVLGVVKVPSSNGLSVDGSGNVAVTLATGSVFGTVKVTAANGLGLASGVVSLALGTGSTAGTVIVPTANGLSVSSGSVAVALGTGSTAGTVIVPTANGLSVSSGSVAVALGTGSTAGTVIVPTANGLSVSSGSVAVALAGTTTAGTVSVPTAGHLSLSTGALSINTNLVTAAGAVLPTQGTHVPYTSTAVLDATAGNSFVVQTTSGTACDVNFTAAPTAGEPLWIIIKTAGTENVTFGNKITNAATLTSPGAGKTTVIHYISDGATAVEIARTTPF